MKKTICWLWVPPLCEPHSFGPQENRTGYSKTHSIVGLVSVFTPENKPSNDLYIHNSVDSAFQS